MGLFRKNRFYSGPILEPERKHLLLVFLFVVYLYYVLKSGFAKRISIVIKMCTDDTDLLCTCKGCQTENPNVY